VAFSGDTLFRFSIGRTDFEMGSFEDMNNSLHEKVSQIPWDTVVLCGHGEQTTIREEMLSNPYLR
jgi:glyoxylase-like metal-dependent hydrolase (beta-lactamase superfamily II)